MKTIIKYTISLLFLTSIFMVSSCGKKWKKPTNVSCLFQLKNSNPGLVNITSGNIIIEEIDFEGKRKQGTTHVSFDKKYENGLTLPLSLTESDPGIVFDIPQGTYTETDFRIKIKDFNNNPSLTLTGAYINTLSVSVPVIFETESSENIEPVFGSGEVVLIESKNSSATFILNPYYWFQNVSQNMLENATLTNVGGVMTMYINKNENQNIYNAIVGRIKDGNETVFK